MQREFRHATYSDILDGMLAHGARPGQGGHLEGDAEDVRLALGRLDCYAPLANEMANTFGVNRAEALLREAVRGLGRYRGSRIRREVETRGLPLDVWHLLQYWDHAWATEEAVEGSSRQVHGREPHYFAIDVNCCSFHDQMSELCPQRLAVLMCEEDHIAVAKEFNPAIEVWYPSLLTRGEAKCSFRFTMPWEAAEQAAQQARQQTEAAHLAGKPLAGEKKPGKLDAADTYRSLAELVVIFYHYVVDSLLRNVGEEQTEAVVRRAMRAFGAWRGRIMREDHQKRGWPLDIHSFITYFDDPAAGDAWLANNVTLTATAHTKDVTRSAYADMFDRIGTGRFAALMYEEALPAQAAAYNPAIQVAIPMLMERGDPYSRFSYTLAG
jgi:hypothetical protein